MMVLGLLWPCCHDRRRTRWLNRATLRSANIVNRSDPRGENATADGTRLLVDACIPQIGLRSMVALGRTGGVRGARVGRAVSVGQFPLADRAGRVVGPRCRAASWARAWAPKRAKRAWTSCSRRPSTCTGRPYGGRHFEAFSEDPVLTGELASEYVRGIQSHGVGATVKHYVANESETDRFTVDVRVEERTLRELYLLAFEAPVVEARRVAGDECLQLDQRRHRDGERPAHDPAERRVGLRWCGRQRLDGRAFDRERPHAIRTSPCQGPQGAWGEALLRSVREGR